MIKIPKTLAVCAGVAVLHSAAPAQEPEHYVRETVIVDQSALTIEQVAIASDQELTTILYREGVGSNLVLAVSADGRALGDEFSAPETVSSASNVTRTLTDDSIHVLNDTAFALWADDDAGGAATRLWFNRRQSGAWGTASALPDGGLLGGRDLKSWSAAVGTEINGGTTIAALACYSSGGGDELYLHLSVNGGNSFLPPQEVSNLGVSPGTIQEVEVDLAGISLHCAWIDDRSTSRDVYHRSAVVDFFGGLAWQQADLRVSSVIGTEAVQGLELAVNGEFAWSGTDGKYVGIAWLQDTGDTTRTLLVAASHDHGITFFPETIVRHTNDPGVDVEDFDFEISGDTFHAAWQDNWDAGTRQVFRVASDDGTSWDGITNSDFEPVSGPSATGVEGFSPGITRSVKVPDATCIYWTENDSGTLRVVTAFADQSLGGAFHDEYPATSNGAEVSESGFGPIGGAYNFLYNNFALAWLVDDGFGVKDLVVGGYRPHAVEVEDFSSSELTFHFFVEHLPFQDLYGFVLISSSTSGPPLFLADGRNTGLVRDSVTDFGLANFALFVGPNSSAIEGAETPEISTALVPLGLNLRYVGVSIGPFGEPHVITDVFEETFQ